MKNNADTINPLNIHDQEFEKARKEDSKRLKRANAANYSQFLFNRILIVLLLVVCFYQFYVLQFKYDNQVTYVVSSEGNVVTADKLDLNRHDREIEKFLHEVIEMQMTYTSETYLQQMEKLKNYASKDYLKRIRNEDLKANSLAAFIKQSDFAKMYLKEFVVENIERKGSVYQVLFTAVRGVHTGEEELSEEVRSVAILKALPQRSKENPFGIKLYSTTVPGNIK